MKQGSTVGTFSYDARGNILTADLNSYTYSGDRLTSFSPFGQLATNFTHDSRGRMTYDGASGVTIDYNYLNLTRKISGTGGTLAKYSYLANGSKTGAENGSGEGLVYRGSLIYKKASGGTLTFDGASIPEGRLLSGATRLYVTDHLGSVKAVVNGNNGNLYEVNNYTVYGKRSANSSASSYISTAPSGEKFRQHFTGKEDQAPDFTVPFTDFGARQYSPVLRRWLVPDPLSEKYYGISPYAYCHDNPVSRVDIDGSWDVKVHVYSDRKAYGYGIAIVTDRTGREVFRFPVRAQGANGANRMAYGSDTPLGTYDIPSTSPWITGGSRVSYGPFARLHMEGVSGEIIDSNRSGIRIHGGRQEIEKDGVFINDPNAGLKKTLGCLRAYDSDMNLFKIITDNLTNNDSQESPGNVVVLDDLIGVTVPSSSDNFVEAKVEYSVPDDLNKKFENIIITPVQ